MPQSDVPGEHTSPTQPFPTKPAPFARQTFTEARHQSALAARPSRKILRQKLRTSRNEGLFTPPSFQGSIGMPGHNGGANWAGSAVDPVNGELYIVSKNLPVMLRVELSERGAVGAHRQRPRRHARGSGGDSGGRESRGGARPDPLLGAVRLLAQPDERHGRDGPAVVGDHGVRLEHRRDQMARAARRRDRHRRGRRRALPARRAARDGRRSRVRRHGAGPAAARLRSRQRQGALVVHAARRLGRHSGDLRARRPAVSRRARRGRRGLVRAAARPGARGAADWSAPYIVFALPRG